MQELEAVEISQNSMVLDDVIVTNEVVVDSQPVAETPINRKKQNRKTSRPDSVMLRNTSDELENLNKPMEERLFTDFYPDLDVNASLEVIYHTAADIQSAKQVVEEQKEEIDIEGDVIFDDYPTQVLIPTSKVPVQLVIPTIPKTQMKEIPIPSFKEISTPDPDIESPPPQNAVERPEEYIKHHEPTDKELDKMIEYDMDTQDQYWLATMNELRRNELLGSIPEAFFEHVMDRLEKEWFYLTKDIRIKKEVMDYPEDITCSICDDGECENSNAIVFCDGCNIAVHQDCYGVPFIPEGQWLCRKCLISPEQTVSCLLCPSKTGAFKQTTTSKWAHSICALWIPEVTVSNPVYMEPIENISLIPKSRWKLTCYICKKRMGACIQCDKSNCFTAFHVTCARKAKLYMKIRSDMDGNVNMKAYCDRHTPKEYLEDIDVPTHFATAVYQMAHLELEEKLARKKRKKKNSLLNPVVPSYVYGRVLATFKDVQYPRKSKFIAEVCKYWSLKREERRGAPLLKRLHIEPWTSSEDIQPETEEIRAQRRQARIVLRQDLEKLRMLTDLLKRREKEKLKYLNVLRDYVGSYLYPIGKILLRALSVISKKDNRKFFANPVDTKIVTDYLKFVKKPMDFSTIQKKIMGFEYRYVDEFEADMKLVFSNCKTYNNESTEYWRLADRLENILPTVIEEVKKDFEQHVDDNGLSKTKFDETIFDVGRLDIEFDKLKQENEELERELEKLEENESQWINVDETVSNVESILKKDSKKGKGSNKSNSKKFSSGSKTLPIPASAEIPVVSVDEGRTTRSREASKVPNKGKRKAVSPASSVSKKLKVKEVQTKDVSNEESEWVDATMEDINVQNVLEQPEVVEQLVASQKVKSNKSSSSNKKKKGKVIASNIVLRTKSKVKVPSQKNLKPNTDRPKKFSGTWEYVVVESSPEPEIAPVDSGRKLRSGSVATTPAPEAKTEVKPEIKQPSPTKKPAKVKSTIRMETDQPKSSSQKFPAKKSNSKSTASNNSKNSVPASEKEKVKIPEVEPAEHKTASPKALPKTIPKKKDKESATSNNSKNTVSASEKEKVNTSAVEPELKTASPKTSPKKKESKEKDSVKDSQDTLHSISPKKNDKDGKEKDSLNDSQAILPPLTRRASAKISKPPALFSPKRKAIQSFKKGPHKIKEKDLDDNESLLSLIKQSKKKGKRNR